jgi:hypothetical protein
MKFAVTPAQIGVARAKLAEAGCNLAGEVGVLQRDGYRIGYALEQGRRASGLSWRGRVSPIKPCKIGDLELKLCLGQQPTAGVLKVKTPSRTTLGYTPLYTNP